MMYTNDLKIKEQKGAYILVYQGQVIECLFSNDIVSSNQKSLIEHIRDDFDRCGYFEIEENKIQTNGIKCAYHIFSIQKFQVEDDEIYRIILESYPNHLKSDWAINQAAVDEHGAIEKLEINRLAPVRDAIKNQIGDSAFNELRLYILGEWEFNINSDTDIEESDKRLVLCGRDSGKYITDDAFKNTDVSKVIIELIEEFSIEETACFFTLCESTDHSSILFPLSLLKGWITKSEYISGSMILAGNISNLSGLEGTNRSHQESFSYHSNIVEICTNYSSESKRNPLFLLEESLTYEFKTSFRTPYPNYPDSEVDKSGQTIYKMGNKIFKKRKEVESFIETQCLKTIVAFLNTKGGTIVIGVYEKDNVKELVGIGREGFKSQDAYERHISQSITNRIGKKFHGDFINIETIIDAGKSFCLIKCKEYIPAENQIPAHLDQEKCFRRTGPRTDELKGAEAATFAVERLKQINA